MRELYTNWLQTYDGKFTCAPYAVLIMLSKLIRWFEAALRERQTWRELRQLDDHMLRDIGLDRGQLGRH
jgi:uncharacterized protein YjiS (DUF1127 family)